MSDLKLKVDPNKELTEEDFAAIEAEANAEFEGKETEHEEQEEKTETKEKVLKEEKEETKPEEKKEEPTEESPEAQWKARAEAAGLTELASEEEVTAKEKFVERAKSLGLDAKATEEQVKQAEEKTAKAEPTAEDVKAYALKYDLSEDQAKIDIKKNRETLDWYKSPENMARSHRNLQSEYDRLKEKVDRFEKEVPKQQLPSDPEKAIRVYVEKNSEKIIEAFKQNFPAKSELMSDEAILEEVADKQMQKFEIWREKQGIETGKKAADAREELLNGVPEKDREFLPDIKAGLKQTPDSAILEEGFDLKDIIRWAKGGKFDEAVTKAREEGLKAGREEKKILGEKLPPKPKGTGGKTGSSQTVSLTDDQKESALEKFDISGISDEEKFKMFKETYAKDLAKNPKYVP
jgi:hypothetical protein